MTDESAALLGQPSSETLIVSHPHILSIAQLVRAVNTNIQHGLSSKQHIERLCHFGRNVLPTPHLSFLRVLKSELTEPLIVMLLFVAVLYLLWGELQEAMTAVCIIMCSVMLEVYTEYKAKNAVQKLMSSDHVRSVLVLRDGTQHTFPSDELTIGDVVDLVAGDQVPADGRLISEHDITVEQSAMTGESEDVVKKSSIECSESVPSAQQSNMLLKGSIVTLGHARMIVTAIGTSTTIGQLYIKVGKMKQPKTQLQKMVKRFTTTLTIIAAISVVLVIALSFWRGYDYMQILLAALSLSFAVIPEELPILIKVMLGVTAQRLSQRNVVVKSLKAAESLGSVTTLLTDKTGTLTTNQLQVHTLVLPNDVELDVSNKVISDNAKYVNLLQAWLYSSQDVEHNIVGRSSVAQIRDRFDKAVLNLLSRSAATYEGLQETQDSSPLLNVTRMLPFDSWRRRSSCVVTFDKQTWMFTRGSVECVLHVSRSYLTATGQVNLMTEKVRAHITQHLGEMAGLGLRTLAFARQELTDSSLINASAAELEADMTFVGMMGFSDTIKPNVTSTIRQLQNAGITVKMISGDHAASAEATARQCEIIDRMGHSRSGSHTVSIAQATYSGNSSTRTQSDETKKSSISTDYLVYANVTPDDKFDLVCSHQQQGDVVMVTGDGFNDGLSLKGADVGLAMGESGTDMARHSATLILTDDDFSSVLTSVAEGRCMLVNLWSSIRFYLACKLALVLLFVTALVIGTALPLAPIQIIVLESFMDLGAGACFVLEPPNRHIMLQPAVQWANGGLGIGRNAVLSHLVTPVLAAGVVLWLVVGTSFVIGLSLGTKVAHSMVWVTWLFGHVLLANSMRSETILRSSVLTSNYTMLSWSLLAMMFASTTVSSSRLRKALSLTPLTPTYSKATLTLPLWSWAIGLPCGLFLIVELLKLIYQRIR